MLEVLARELASELAVLALGRELGLVPVVFPEQVQVSLEELDSDPHLFLQKYPLAHLIHHRT